jgi:hypothetical protein
MILRKKNKAGARKSACGCGTDHTPEAWKKESDAIQAIIALAESSKTPTDYTTDVAALVAGLRPSGSALGVKNLAELRVKLDAMVQQESEWQSAGYARNDNAAGQLHGGRRGFVDSARYELNRAIGKLSELREYENAQAKKRADREKAKKKDEKSKAKAGSFSSKEKKAMENCLGCAEGKGPGKAHAVDCPLVRDSKTGGTGEHEHAKAHRLRTGQGRPAKTAKAGRVAKQVQKKEAVTRIKGGAKKTTDPKDQTKKKRDPLADTKRMARAMSDGALKAEIDSLAEQAEAATTIPEARKLRAARSVLEAERDERTIKARSQS